MKLRTLKTEFRDGGFEMVLVKRVGMLCIYAQTRKGHPFAYEVAIVRVTDPHPLGKGGWDKVEVYPSNESFGTLAWSVQTLERANEMFDDILNANPDLLVNLWESRLAPSEGQHSGQGV